MISGTPPATNATITGLTNGTAYTFTVTATNAVGNGPASEASNSVTPAAAPSAPTGVSAVAGNKRAKVSWSAPANNGSPITSYTITPFVGSTAQPATTINGTPPATSTTITGLTNGTTYTFTVTATNAIGTSPASEKSASVTPTAFQMDVDLTANGNGTLATPSFSTAEAGEQILALVSSDGPSGGGKQTVTVSGAGQTWTLVKRGNGTSGDAEIWATKPTKALSNVTVTSTPSAAGFDQSMTIISFEGSRGLGASTSGSSTGSAPSVTFLTKEEGSLVLGVGTDWKAATARTVGANQILLAQNVDTTAKKTFWSQITSKPIGVGFATINDTSPTTDPWDLAAVEVFNAGKGK